MNNNPGIDPLIYINKHPNCWKQRTLLEKILMIICVLAGIIIVALSITFYSVIVINSYDEAEDLDNVVRITRSINEKGRPNAIYDDSDKKSILSNELANICTTKGCIQAASRIFDSIDETVDPCDNFYDFACGNFVKNTFIPDDKVTVDQFSIVRDKVEDQIRYIINQEIKPNELRPFVLVKKLNKICMNTELIEKRGTAPLMELLKQFGGWPVILGDQWSETNWNWLEVLKGFRRTGLDVDVLFSFTVTENLGNSSIRSLDIDQTKTNLARQYLIKGLDEPLVKAYYNLMVDIAVILGADRKHAENDLLDAVNFEIALANISVAQDERRDLTSDFNPHTIKELQELFPYLPWLEYLSAMLPDSVAINENEVVIVNVLKFFRRLGDVLHGASKRTLANYLMWRVVYSTSGDLTEQLRKRKVSYESAVSGQKDELPRWKECVAYTSESLPAAVAALYVRKYFRQDAKKTALELVTNLRRAFLDMLNKISWMDEVTKNSALEKAKALTNHIGYPDELDDDKKLEEYFTALELDPDNFFLNSLKVNKFDLDYHFGKLHDPVNKTDWTMHTKAAVVNAQYAPLENSIQFPAGILQDNFFSPDRPHYLNYGAIGQFIGHEMTHGFDDQGRQFDSHGNLVEWWHDDTKEKFIERAKCIIDQYASFREPTTNLTLNGVISQGENIADNGGLKEAYNAYKTWVSEHGPEKKLPGFNYTPEQMFWISAAQAWCVVSRTEYLKLKIISGTHPLNQYRVLGPVANMRNFSIDFNCPEGAPMNPIKKCEVW